MFLQQSSAADVHWQYFSFVFGIPQSSHVSWQGQFKLDLILQGTMSCSQLTFIEQRHRSLSPSVYYCNISSFQSLVTSHVYMTLCIRQLAIFASKNKQVVQIRIQVSQVEAVLERWSLPLSWCNRILPKLKLKSLLSAQRTELHFFVI